MRFLISICCGISIIFTTLNFASPVQASWFESLGAMLSDERNKRAPLSYIKDKAPLEPKKKTEHNVWANKATISPLKAEKIATDKLPSQKNKMVPPKKTAILSDKASQQSSFLKIEHLPVKKPLRKSSKAKTAIALPERDPRKISITKQKEVNRLAKLKINSKQPKRVKISTSSVLSQPKSPAVRLAESKPTSNKSVSHFSKMLRTAFQPLLPEQLKDGHFRVKVVDVDKKRRNLVPLRAYRIPTDFNQFPRIYIRIFKKEHELELWERVRSRYVKKKTYKICKWSGRLGPKLKEGDKQAPEGFYTVTTGQIGWFTKKWRHSFNIGFPNKFDQAYARTGSDLLVHGGCKSIGCYAMTNENMWELYNDVATYMLGGVKDFPMHIYPFRMTNKNMLAYKDHKWIDFWKQLKPGYDLFEAEQMPPVARVCNKSYKVFSRLNARRALSTRTNCAPVLADWARNRQIRFPRPRNSTISKAEAIPGRTYQSFLPSSRKQSRIRRLPKATTSHGLSLIPPATTPSIPVRRKPQIVIKCNLKRPSCRRWLYLKKKRLASQTRRGTRQRVSRSRAKFRQKRKRLSRRSRNQRRRH